MRILVLINTFPGRSESFIINQIAGLIERGHDVTIAAKKRDMSDAEACAAFPVYERLGMGRRTFYFPGMEGSRFARVRRGLPRLSGFFLRRPWAFCSALLFAVKTGDFAALQGVLIAGRVKSGNFDIMLCQFGPLGNVGVLLKQIGDYPGLVATAFRGSDLTSYLRRTPRAYRYLKVHGDLFFPVSTDFKKRLEQRGFIPERVFVLYSGIDSGDFQFKGLPQLSPDSELVLLSVGRLVEKKGFVYILQAVKLLTEQGIRVRLSIAGDGPLSGELREQASAWSIDACVQFLGWIPHNQVLKLMDESHILINHSITAASGDTEGIPNVLKEAMAVGVPVISTRHAGIPDLVHDGENGFLVEERDFAALAERIRYVQENWAEMNLMVRNARKTIEEEFDVSVVTDRVETIFSRTLDKRTRKKG